MCVSVCVCRGSKERGISCKFGKFSLVNVKRTDRAKRVRSSAIVIVKKHDENG